MRIPAKTELEKALKMWDQPGGTKIAYNFLAEAGGFKPAREFLFKVCTDAGVAYELRVKAEENLHNACKRFYGVPIPAGMTGRKEKI